MLKSVEEYTAVIKDLLLPKRFFHSQCVCEEAARLAALYGADAEKARVAGILHDICKNMSDSEQLKIFERFGIILTSIEKKEKKLWHAISGAAYIENVLKVDDSDILNAVRYHTTARENMSLLERVVYIADFTSADRDYDGVDGVRADADESLDKAMLTALSFTVTDLAARGKCIHPDTLFAYNEIAAKMDA